MAVPPAELRGVADVLLACPFQMGQVLLQCRLIKLSQEFGMGGDVVPTNIINELTLSHTLFSVGIDRPFT
jgi:hypothetical protein